MTRPLLPSISPELRIAAAISVAIAGLLLPSRAAGQACCAGGALVTPTRLAPYEDWGLGLQTTARNNRGAFDSTGHFATSTSTDQQIQEQIVASVRLSRRDQIGALLPFVQTHRAASSIDEWGGGIGDIAVSYRHDFLLAAEAAYWPGIALLAGTTLPTGTAADQAENPLATDATGAGTYDLALGFGLEKVHGHLYLALNNWLTHRFDREADAGGGVTVKQSFALRWTWLATAGYVFDSEAAVAAYVTGIEEGASTIDGVSESATRVRATTVGVAGVLPLQDHWRLQGSLFSDVMLASFGRNQLGGVGLTLSVVRLWL